MLRQILSSGAFGVALVASAACAGDSTSPETATALLYVTPVSGAANVDPHAPMIIQFTGPMASGMERYVALHRGSVTGELVAVTAVWSSDRIQLTVTPVLPLQPRGTYALHIGGGMVDERGMRIDYDRYGPHMGGMWVTGGMMGGGGMMDPGWRNANGSYGMVFVFTTA